MSIWLVSASPGRTVTIVGTTICLTFALYPSPLRGPVVRAYDQRVTLVRVDANVPWNVLKAAGGNWVGVCQPLKLTVQAETWAELMEDIGLTLNALMHDLLESNELNRFLRDQGWTLIGRVPERFDDVRFDVPFLPAMMANGTARELRQ